MSSQPLVSILIPAFNAEKFIADSLNSVLNQTYQNTEIIVCDDNSTDQTWKIICEHAKLSKKIAVYKNSSNLGIAGNRNKLLSLAKGDFIAWQDADDISLPERIEKQLNYLISHPEVVIVGSWIRFFGGRNSSVRKYFEKDSEIRKRIFRYSPVAQPSAMIRKSALILAGEYDKLYPPAEDLDMSFRLGKIGKFANLQEVLLNYRDNFSGATRTKLKIVEEKTISIRLRYSNNGYQMSASDHVYNLLQYFSSLFLPAKCKISLFNWFRNSPL